MAGRIKAMTGRIRPIALPAAATAAGDLLEALAPLLRVRPVLEDFCRFGGSWAADHAASGPDAAQFHIVTRGTCRLERPGRPEIALRAGDILLLPHGDRHVVRSRGDGPRQAITASYRNAIRAKTTAGAAIDTELICGHLAFEAGKSGLLAAALPDEIVIRTGDPSTLPRLRTLLGEIREELDANRAGAGLIAGDLARAMLAMMLRFHLEQETRPTALLSLLRDRAAAKVLLALLKQPDKDWSLDEMAALGFTSRATLVRTFRKLCGMAPAALLGDLRLQLARQRLAGTAESVARIAAAVGYRSEGALSRAFLRKFGIRPGALRRRDAV